MKYGKSIFHVNNTKLKLPCRKSMDGAEYFMPFLLLVFMNVKKPHSIIEPRRFKLSRDIKISIREYLYSLAVYVDFKKAFGRVLR